MLPDDDSPDPSDAAREDRGDERPDVSPAVPDTGAFPLPERLSPDDERHSAAEARRTIDRRVAAVVEGMSDAFLAIGPDWRITYANREAARLNGTVPEALIGTDHWEQWPETRGEIERQYRRVIAERAPAHFEHHYPGVGVWHEIRAYPADDGGLAVFYRDITAQKLMEAERSRQARDLLDAHQRMVAAETLFRLLVDHVRDYAVFLMDPDGVITHWGPGAERIKKWRADEIVGRHLRTLYPSEERAEDGTAEEHLRHAAAHGEYIGEGTRMRRGAEPFPARVVLTALRQGGRLVGFSKIAQDLTGERERQRALEQAMSAAQSASTAKSQFLANTSHEIRTPLNAIIGYAELLDLGLAGDLSDPQRHYLSRIQATSRHLLTLVNDVLDLSKIEAGEMRTARELSAVAEVVAAALQLVEPQARARRIVLTNGCRDDVMYHGDPERVRQILVNLLSNAVRFTEPEGRVTVTCGSAEHAPAEANVVHQGALTYVRVEDTGAGIAPEQLDRIWDAFVQVGSEAAGSSYTRKFGGSGLGLTISRHLARLMGGDVTVRSQPGLGSTFVLWLPAAHESPRADASVERAPAPAPTDGAAVEDPIALVGRIAPDDALHLQEISDALLTESERVVAMYVARMRADPDMPNAHGLRESEAEDHGITFLTDVAQCLAVVGQDGPEAVTMLRDGSAIQRLIATRHGRQRARLGWTEEELHREYAILRDEVHMAVRRRVTRGGGPAVEQALGILNHMLAVAERESVYGFRAAAAGDPPPPTGGEGAYG